jgi:hypothetical protein
VGNVSHPCDSEDPLLVQVLEKELVVLSSDGDRVGYLQVIPEGEEMDDTEAGMEASDKLVAASCASKHLCLLSQRRVCLIYSITQHKIVLLRKIKGVAFANIYFDQQGVFSSKKKVQEQQRITADQIQASLKRRNTKTTVSNSNSRQITTNDDLDDLDADLYGESDVDNSHSNPKGHQDQNESLEMPVDESIPLKFEPDQADIVTIAFVGTSGHILVQRASDGADLFAARGVHEHPMSISDDESAIWKHGEECNQDFTHSRVSIAQIHIKNFGHRVEDTYLFVRARSS